MEKKIVYQKEDNNNKNILLDEKEIIIKNNSINGSGSESLLNSIHSEKKEIEHSTKSSIDLIALSNNSMNISNENKNTNDNIQNNSLNNNDNPNNNNEKNLIESDLSGIKNISLVGSKNEINDFIYMLKENNNNDSEKKIDNLLDSNISQNNSQNQNELNHSNNNDSINNSQDKNQKNNESNNSKKSNRLNEKNKLEIKKKIKEGFIPFFIQVKGNNALFYYGKPDTQIKIPIDHYTKNINISNTKKINFYYDNKLIDINKTIGELGIVKFSLIRGEIP
jgi:hypothetical protein